MNTKRQTIWLVSMLSLMVILSAYYLFTQDINSDKQLTDATNLQNSSEVNLVVDEEATTVSGTAEDGSNYTISDLEQEMLTQLEKDGYFNSSTFSNLIAKRENQLEEKENQVMSVLADVSADKDRTQDAISELAALEQKMEKLTQLESELQETYEIAHISEEVDDKFKVVIASDNLEKKQAAQIIEQVIADLEVRPDQVSVEFVPNP
ncbi:SpoIIIAH-like family protein [Paenibacillus septentrionalis]|uniref:SpoIIIAH-like family protein n=1 Tax=Paenibacillus septentrionalis TaxID=429342 RepID=A0ABW1V1Q8_9BACL